jgi:lauroyl/myristoyl acyltransferase
VAVEKLHPAAVFDFYSRMRNRHGVAVAPAGGPGRTPLETLRRNGILGIVADRPFGRRQEEVACGEALLAVPSGAIRLALRHGAAIHTGFARREAGGFELRIGPDWGPELRAITTEPARLQHAAGLFAATLRESVECDPWQWCLFRPLPSGAATAARDAA